MYRAVLARSGGVVVVGGELRVNLMHKVSRKALGGEAHSVEIDSSGQIHIVTRITYSALLFRSHSQLAREVDSRLRGLIKTAQALLIPILVEINQPTRAGEERLAAKKVDL